jgi:hypothetical protein
MLKELQIEIKVRWKDGPVVHYQTCPVSSGCAWEAINSPIVDRLNSLLFYGYKFTPHTKPMPLAMLEMFGEDKGDA